VNLRARGFERALFALAFCVFLDAVAFGEAWIAVLLAVGAAHRIIIHCADAFARFLTAAFTLAAGGCDDKGGGKESEKKKDRFFHGTEFFPFQR
jgi:hypothetical protein